jgi:hypothetical protein
MSRTRTAKKKEAKKQSKTKAAEAGVSAAQKVFSQVLAKADPK